MYENIGRKVFNNEAMRSGTLLGLLWIVIYAVALGAFSNPAYSLLFMILNIASPFYAGYLAVRFRKNVCGGALKFVEAWLYVLIEYLCASLLVAVVIFVYLRFVNSTVVADAMNNMVEVIKTDQQVYTAMGEELIKAVEVYTKMSVKDIVFNITTSNLMNGTILAPIIALFVKRNKQ